MTPYLLTPGPLTTSATVKHAMLNDHGSWDGDFNAMTARICQQLLQIAAADDSYQCVPMQGSGTFAVESALGSLIAPTSKSLVLANGAYGQRIAQILRYLKRPFSLIDTGDYLPVSQAELEARLAQEPDIEQVIVVHCETSSGIVNPLAMISQVCQAHGRKLFVDSMSAFGALKLDVQTLAIDAIIASANKCLHGVPGFGFVICRRQLLEQAEGNSHSLSLDLFAQWHYMQRTGQWRFTPPTHVVAACEQALVEYWQQGGQPARLALYQANHRILLQGLQALGLKPLLAPKWQSPMITTFFAPESDAFVFADFYQQVKAQGYLIYPGKLTQAETFRVGSMGELTADIMRGAVKAIGQSLAPWLTPAAPQEALL